MIRYEFEVVLKDISEMTDEVANRLYEAGCDDGSPYSCDGHAAVVFHRDADFLEQAVRSAVADVRSAGYRVERIVTDEAQIIERLNRELQTA